MVRRTRDIQKKIWLTPQEERTIAKKMEMIGTENFGAYARKMLIVDELVDTNLDISTAKPLEVPSPVTLIVLSGLVIDVMPPATAVLILSGGAFHGKAIYSRGTFLFESR